MRANVNATAKCNGIQFSNVHIESESMSAFTIWSLFTTLSIRFSNYRLLFIDFDSSLLFFSLRFQSSTNPNAFDSQWNWLFAVAFRKHWRRCVCAEKNRLVRLFRLIISQSEWAYERENKEKRSDNLMQSIGILWTKMLTLYYGSIITWFAYFFFFFFLFLSTFIELTESTVLNWKSCRWNFNNFDKP